MTKRANFPFLCLFLPRRDFGVDVSTPGRKPGWYVYFHLLLLASPRTLNNTQTQTIPNNVYLFLPSREQKEGWHGQHGDGHSVFVSMPEEAERRLSLNVEKAVTEKLNYGSGLWGYFLLQYRCQSEYLHGRCLSSACTRWHFLIALKCMCR